MKRYLICYYITAGYIIADKVSLHILELSQSNLLAKRGAIWGRLLVMKMFGIPVPKLTGFSLFKNWLRLPLKEKLRSILGTVRRIIHRGYYKPVINNEANSMIFYFIKFK